MALMPTFQVVGLRAITFKLKTERAKLSFASENVEVCYAGLCRSSLSFAPVSEGYSCLSPQNCNIILRLSTRPFVLGPSILDL